MRARPLNFYFKQTATATINLIADEYVTRIDTDDGWYLEPPATESLMEALRQIKLWAGDDYEVAVIEDFKNASISPRGIHKSENRKKRPRDVVAAVKADNQRLCTSNARRQQRGAA